MPTANIAPASAPEFQSYDRHECLYKFLMMKPFSAADFTKEMKLFPKEGRFFNSLCYMGFTKTPGSLIFLHGSRNVQLRSKASLRPVGAFFEAMRNGIYTLGVWRCTPSFLMIRTLRCPSTKISCSEFLIFRPTRKRLSGRCIRSAQQLWTRWSIPRERGETSLCSLAC